MKSFRKQLVVGAVLVGLGILAFDATKTTETTKYVSNNLITSTEREPQELLKQEVISDEEMNYLTRCVMAEAGNQGYTGQRLVASVILNRVDSERYPNTIIGVITAKGQFSVWPRAMSRVVPTESVIKACRDELLNRSDNNFLYFRTGRGHRAGAFQHKDHYFN